MSVGITLADVIEGLTGERPDGLGEPISTTVVDSRRVEPGALFVALKGEHVDGHDFVAQAFSQGAVAAIVQREVEAEATRMDLTGAKLKLPAELSPPLLMVTSNALEALQRLATFWRSRHDVRIIGITGSVGKTTITEVARSLIPFFVAMIMALMLVSYIPWFSMWLPGVMGQQRQRPRTPIGSHQGAPPDPPSRRLVMRGDGRRTRA